MTQICRLLSPAQESTALRECRHLSTGLRFTFLGKSFDTHGKKYPAERKIARVQLNKNRQDSFVSCSSSRPQYSRSGSASCFSYCQYLLDFMLQFAQCRMCTCVLFHPFISHLPLKRCQFPPLIWLLFLSACHPVRLKWRSRRLRNLLRRSPAKNRPSL